MKRLYSSLINKSVDRTKKPFSDEIFQSLKYKRLKFSFLFFHIIPYFKESHGVERFDRYVYRQYYNTTSFRYGLCATFVQHYLKTGEYLNNKNGATVRDILADYHEHVVFRKKYEFINEFPFFVKYHKNSLILEKMGIGTEGYIYYNSEGIDVADKISMLKNGVYHFDFRSKERIPLVIIIKNNDEIIVYDPRVGTYKFDGKLPEAVRLDVLKCNLA